MSLQLVPLQSIYQGLYQGCPIIATKDFESFVSILGCLAIHWCFSLSWQHNVSFQTKAITVGFELETIRVEGKLHDLHHRPTRSYLFEQTFTTSSLFFILPYRFLVHLCQVLKNLELFKILCFHFLSIFRSAFILPRQVGR